MEKRPGPRAVERELDPPAAQEGGARGRGGLAPDAPSDDRDARVEEGPDRAEEPGGGRPGRFGEGGIPLAHARRGGEAAERGDAVDEEEQADEHERGAGARGGGGGGG